VEEIERDAEAQSVAETSANEDRASGLLQLTRQEIAVNDMDLIGDVLKYLDSRLELILTAQLSQQVADEARKFFSDRVYRTMIPRNVRLSEAPSFGKPIIHYDGTSSGAASYRALAQEVIHHD